MNNDFLFFRLWRNKVINKVIFSYSRLYIENKEKTFKNIQELREYGEREYITKLVFKNAKERCEPFSISDLPEYGVLKEVDFSFYFTPIKCFDIIPYGVEIIRFNGYNEVQLSELPTSLHTISNVLLKKPYSNNQIPNNITSLSFSNGFIVPQSIASSLIPPSVTELTSWIGEYTKVIPVIPSTVSKLRLFIHKGSIEKGLIPFGVKELIIGGSNQQNTFNLSVGSLPDSITKLTIHRRFKICIEPNSLPNSLLHLKIQYNEYPKSFNGICPNSLTHLVISGNKKCGPPPPTISELPNSIKYLNIDDNEITQFN